MISREQVIEGLLNRMQSGDLKTLLSLQQTAQAAPDISYQSSHDVAELKILAGGQGLGMELYDDGVRDADEFAAALDELGIPTERE